MQHGSLSTLAREVWCPPEVTLYTVGARRPQTPGGWACWAWAAQDAVHNELAYDYGCLGRGPHLTEAVAEYVAVGKALRWAADQHLPTVRVRVGSRLVVEQAAGRWPCKTPALRPLLGRLQELIAGTGATLEWLPHDRNLRASNLTYAAFWEARRV